MLLFVYQWFECPQACLRAFAFDETNKVHMLDCKGFCPWFYTSRRIEQPVVQVDCTKRTIYGNKSKQLVQCFFPTTYAKNKAAEKLPTDVECFEGTYDINAIIQMIAISGCPAVGWVELAEASPRPGPNGLLVHNLSWQNDRFVDDSTACPLLPRPDVMKLPSPKRFSFDIETYFADHTIPMEKGVLLERAQDCITCITLYIREDGGRDDKVGLVLKGVENIRADFCGTDFVIECETEHQLLTTLVDILEKERCPMMMGYNSLRFDVSYLTLKMEKYGRQEGDAKGPQNNIFTRWRSLSLNSFAGREIKKANVETKQSGKRMSSLHTILWQGIIQIDLYAFVVRDYNLKDNSLGAVAAFFLDGDTKDDMSPAGMFAAHENKTYELLLKYCMKDTILVDRLFEKLKVWPTIVELTRLCKVSIFDVQTGGEHIRSFNLIYDIAFNDDLVVNGAPPSVKKTGKYKGAFVLDPIRGVYVWTTISLDFASLYPSIMCAYNMCHTTYVSEEDYLCMNPEERSRLNEFVLEYHDGCVHDPKNAQLQALDDSLARLDEKKKALALEHAENLRGLNKAMRKTLKTLQDAEFSREKEAAARQKTELMGQRAILKESMTKKGKDGASLAYCTQRGLRSATKHYFYKAEFVQGLLPKVLRRLLDGRKKVKEQMEALQREQAIAPTKEREVEILLLNKRQSALKVVANAMYGMCGASFGLQHAHISACVTHVGRSALLKMKTLIEEMQGIIVYGDTDSNYVCFPQYANMSHAEIVQHANMVAEKVTAEFPAPMKLAFEHHYAKLLLLNKKCYVNLHVKPDGTEDPKLYSKGTKLDRCEWPTALQTIYKDCIMKVLLDDAATQEDFRAYLQRQVDEMCKHYVELLPAHVQHVAGFFDLSSFPLADLAQTKKMKGDYSQHKNKPSHYYAAERAKKFGLDVSATTMIAIVICKQDTVGADGLLESKEKKLEHRVHHLEVVKMAKEYRRLDGPHYVDLLRNAVEPVVKVKFPAFTMPTPTARPFALENFLHLMDESYIDRPDLVAAFAFCATRCTLAGGNFFAIQTLLLQHPQIGEAVRKVLRLRWGRDLLIGHVRTPGKYPLLAEAINRGDVDEVDWLYRRHTIGLLGRSPTLLAQFERDFLLLLCGNPSLTCLLPKTTIAINRSFAVAVKAAVEKRTAAAVHKDQMVLSAQAELDDALADALAAVAGPEYCTSAFATRLTASPLHLAE